MSVILDVLKKLDREKPSRRDQPPNIATDILRPDPPRPKRRLRLNIIIVSLTAIVTAAITFVIMKEFIFLSKPSSPLPPSPPGPSLKVKPAPLEFNPQKKSPPPEPVRPPEPVQGVAPTPPLREPVRDTKEDVTRGVPKTEAVPESKVHEASKIPEIPKVSEVPKVPVENKPSSPPPAPPVEKKPVQSVLPEKKEIAPVEPPKKSPETPVAGTSTRPPSLTISAIVWYEDPSMRFAIVNGLKAVEGSVIEGVKVVEINRTSVRFLHNQKHFDVSISR